MTTERKPHVHAALIKAWADGALIQFRNLDDEWVDVLAPDWHFSRKYRIKPEPKPDIVVVRYVHVTPTVCPSLITHYQAPRMDYPENKMQYTFDGETGKLKGVKLL
jgi:hypothetical protein